MIILVFRYFWQKKIFSNPPCMGCLTGGRGESAFWGGGLLTLDQNETFHSLFLCYPATFGEKKLFFTASLPLVGPHLWGWGKLVFLWPNIALGLFQG